MKHTLHWEMTPMDKNGIFGLQKGQHQSFESREHSRPSNTKEWQSMNALVAKEHRATSEIHLGDQNLTGMQALHWEIPDLKLRRTCCLDSSLVSANLTRTPCRTGENDTDGQV